MSIANLRGGFNVLLNVTQNGSNESLCILQKPLLKKAENWSLQITDLHVNKTPPLNRELHEQLRIEPFGDAFNEGYRESDFVFTPKTGCYTVMEYVLQLQKFFDKFSFLFFKYGVENALGVTLEEEKEFVAEENIATTPVHYTRSNIVGGVEEGFLGKRKICVVSLSSDMRLNITLYPTFLSNFYIVCQPHFATRLGFPEAMFYITTDPGNEEAVAFPPDVLFEELDALTIDQRQVPLQEWTVTSNNSVRELDDRIALELTSTFPVSRKTSVLDGVQQETYVLARFDLSEYKLFETTTSQTNDGMSRETEITETYEAGLENLTRGNPDFESNHLLSGSLQQVHLVLRVQYRTRGVLETVPYDCNDGFWTTRMLFSKKV